MMEKEIETDPFLPSLMGDPVQLDQVVMNLVTNASDAIDSTGGNIIIRTGICLPDEQVPTQSEDPISIYLEVEDDGSGIPTWVTAPFEPGSEPCARTVRRGIERGDIPGRKVGGQWFVDLHLFESGNDPLVARVLGGDDMRLGS